MKRIPTGTLITAPISAVSLIEAFGDIKDFPNWFQRLTEVHQTVRGYFFAPFSYLGLDFTNWQSDFLYLSIIIFICLYVSLRETRRFIGDQLKKRGHGNLKSEKRKKFNLDYKLIFAFIAFLAIYIPPVSLAYLSGALSDFQFENYITKELISSYISFIFYSIAQWILLICTLGIFFDTLRRRKSVLKSAKINRDNRREWRSIDKSHHQYSVADINVSDIFHKVSLLNVEYKASGEAGRQFFLE